MEARERRASVRAAVVGDAAAIARIYNDGIEDRVATFETEPRSAAEIEAWLDAGHPIVVAEAEGRVAAFAAALPYRARACYAGVRDFSFYVARDMRGRGLGRLVLDALGEAARADGAWKLLSRVFPDNEASRRACAAAGFREVGVYRRHAMLDGVWRDVVIVEKLL